MCWRTSYWRVAVRLENVQVHLRPRTAWEACDLGFLLASRWWLPLVTRWLIVSTPCLLLCLWINTWLSLLLLWWMKPLYEHDLAVFLSRAVFKEEQTTESSSFFSAISFSKSALIRLAMYLTIFRFSPNRCIVAPIVIEEQAFSSQLSRKSYLFKDGSTTTLVVYCAVLCLLLELSIATTLFFGFVSLADSLPVMAQVVIETDSGDYLKLTDFMGDVVPSLIFATCYWLACMLVAPFFVSIGFSMYLNQRTHLEGWDVEVSFKKIAQRLSSALLALCVVLPLVDVDAAVLDHSQAMEEVRSHPAFNETDSSYIPRDLLDLLEDWFGDEPSSGSLPSSASVGLVLEIIGWGAVVFLVCFLIMKLIQHGSVSDWIHNLFLGRVSKSSSSFKPESSDLDVLPQDIERQAKSAWQDGNIRLAFSLVYLGCLREIRLKWQVPIGDDFTEEECHVAISSFARNLANEFTKLLSSWQSVAYAHQEPTEQDFEGSLNFYRYVEVGRREISE